MRRLKDKDILKHRITVRFNKDDKEILRALKKSTGISYAQLIREAVYAYYGEFNRRTNNSDR